jgi:putative transposase
MPRQRRIILPGFPYLRQRGNRRLPVFHHEMDRHVYLKLLVQHCIAQKVLIWSYCLMTNHVHFVVVPGGERSLSLAFQRIDGEYGRYYNTRYEKTGRLWQGPFKACVLGEEHLWNAVRYVERNPVEAGMVRRAEDYRWSSARARCGLREDPILSAGLPFADSIPDWSEWLTERVPEEEVRFIRERTNTGRPCSSDEFARMLEAKLGRSLLPKKAGRKPKSGQIEDEDSDTLCRV